MGAESTADVQQENSPTSYTESSVEEHQRESEIAANDPRDSGSASRDHLTGADWAQIAASIATALALGFVVWQSILMQRQTKALDQSIKSATYQSVASFYVDINKSLATDTAISEAFDSYRDAETHPDAADERRRYWLAFWLLNLYENAFIQFRYGVLAESLWKGIEMDCLEQLKKPYIAQMWLQSKHLYSEEFRNYVTQIFPKEPKADEDTPSPIS